MGQCQEQPDASAGSFALWASSAALPSKDRAERTQVFGLTHSMEPASAVMFSPLSCRTAAPLGLHGQAESELIAELDKPTASIPRPSRRRHRRAPRQAAPEPGTEHRRTSRLQSWERLARSRRSQRHPAPRPLRTACAAALSEPPCNLQHS